MEYFCFIIYLFVLFILEHKVNENEKCCLGGDKISTFFALLNYLISVQVYFISRKKEKKDIKLNNEKRKINVALAANWIKIVCI